MSSKKLHSILYYISKMPESDCFWVNLALTCSCWKNSNNHMEPFMPASYCCKVSGNDFILSENIINSKASETTS